MYGQDIPVRGWVMLIVVVLVWMLLPVIADAACIGSSPNWTVASPYSPTDVQDCITASSNGDTINVPAGTHSWGSVVTLNKAVTLKGAGSGSTVIVDDGTSGAIITITLVSNLTTRLTGFTFSAGSRASANQNGLINVNGQTGGGALDSRRVRIDHNVFDHIKGVHIQIRAYGLIDHNTFSTTPGDGAAIYLFGLDRTYSDARWAEAAGLGTEAFTFIEDNTFVMDAGGSTQRASIDGYNASRAVIRYNTFTRSFITYHGTDSAARFRGGYVIEGYNNSFDNTGGPASTAPFNLRSGTGVLYNNTAANYTAALPISTNVIDRSYYPFDPWGTADGRNPWDKNNAGNPFVSGTATSGTALSMTDSGKSWTTNQWEGYVLRQTSSTCNVPISAINTSNEQITVTGHGFVTGDTVIIQGNVGSTPALVGTYTITVVDANTITLNTIDITTGNVSGWVSETASTKPACSGLILSNTATTITVAGGFFGSSTNQTFTAGDGYEINRVDQAFDMPGVGDGTDLAGVVKPAYVVPNDQQVLPLYEWNNLYGGSTDMDIDNGTRWQYMMVENTHFFNDTTMPGYTAYQYPHPLNVPDVVVTNAGGMDF